MPAPQSRTTLLLNWYANPYHAPILVAQQLGFYAEEGIHLAILEPGDPSDVTELVGLGKVDFGVKAMIHTVAARTTYPLLSIGTLLDEPPTVLFGLKSSGIQTFKDIVGKRIGYIGEFGKKIIDNLAHLAGIESTSYQTIRVGMNVTDAIANGRVDAGIGFSSFQRLELEALAGETVSLRLDQLAGLGCCCFCSIQFIIPEKMFEKEELIRGFLRASQRGAALVTEQPDEAYRALCLLKPQFKTALNHQIFTHNLPFFSRNLLNVAKDWEKVARFCKHLHIVDKTFDISECYTNCFLPAIPHAELSPIACCLEED